MTYLVEVKRIVLEGLKGYPAQVYLFGSRADGTGGPSSDIDVGVLAPEPLPPEVLSAIREQLEESHVPYAVELVDLSQVEPSFREFVQREGLEWTA